MKGKIIRVTLMLASKNGHLETVNGYSKTDAQQKNLIILHHKVLMNVKAVEKEHGKGSFT